MAKTAVKLISSKSTRTNLSNNAIRLSKKYSWEIIAFTWYNYLRKLNN
jgi:glycosyltransferase involved in cell wall biosynthesis